MDIQVTFCGISWKNEMCQKAHFAKQQLLCKVKDRIITITH